MNASITAVVTRCASLAGTTYAPPRTGTRAVSRCPLPGHNDSTPSFSVREDWQSFKCFGACGDNGKGGILDVPIAFGLARDRSEAARFLADLGLIPPSDSSRGTGLRAAPQQTPTEYTDHDALPFELRVDRALALWALEEQIGTVRLRAGRDLIAEMRAARTAKLRVIVARLGDALMADVLPTLTGTCPHDIVYRSACADCARPDASEYEVMA